MTHKTHRILSMIPLMVLYLLSTTKTTQGSLRGSLPFSEFHERVIPGKDFQFSTDIIDDDTNIIATTAYNSSQKVIGMLIKVVSSDRPSDIKTTCFVPYQPDRDMGILPIRRLSRETVLLSAHEIGLTEFLSLILVNTSSCKYEYAYKDVTTRDRLILTSGNSSDERFVLIAPGHTFLRRCSMCKLYFDASRDPPYQKLEGLNFNFNLSSVRAFDMQPLSSIDDTLIITRFINISTNTYVTRLYDFSNNSSNPKYRDLISLENWVDVKNPFFFSESWGVRGMEGKGPVPLNYEMKYSGLSFCWCADNRGNQSIHCSVFREDGSLKFNKTVVYSETMFPWRVERIPNGLILFSVPSIRLTSREARTVKVAVITDNVDDNSISKLNFTGEEDRSVEIKHRQYELACWQIVAWKTRVRELDGSIEVEYMCIHELSVTNHLLYIQ